MSKVYLVGAGPGDEGLITVKALDKLKEADIVIYDNLANPDLLKHCKIDVEKIYVGKISKNHTLTQEEINELIVEKAIDKKIIVRLKGGDPYVFGRGGEEGEHLYKNGIDFEVIPGITSAIGGLAYGGVPITHREYASSFHVFTGHLKNEEDDLDWATISKLQGTMVFLMGVGNLERICTSLINNGKDSKTPVAMIYKATTPYQKTVVGTIDSIVEIAKEEKIKAPSLIVVGDVVKARAYLNTFEKKPLFGKKVVVTRARVDSSGLAKKLKALGAETIEIPTIKIKAINNCGLNEEIRDIYQYSHLIFTSKNSVTIFFDTLFKENKDVRALSNLKITAIGSETSRVLKEYGIVPDLMPEDYVGEGVVKALEEILNPSDRILFPRSKNARSFMVEALSKVCYLKEVHIYETVKEDLVDNSLLEDFSDVDCISFTSGSTVDNFVDFIGREHLSQLDGVKVVSIGPVTSERVGSYGLSVYREAAEHNVDGLVKAVLDCFR
ncbi:uroporphyrinogen III methyltransferase/synthase [Natranaerovirga pectinivora]|uniref:uroporphyrinogen-III C-methyltransferase n=1 Tax=Natranaerovirga pectinivora TaxID=682400 RepID=A0A4R3MKA2_9FIRM|nr:uroporphyrinogen-III C-methyltransferase [Natranaerovirga pectinivora]TCT14251.1 uroporphyrinogen III methyltransferase/synthase [Natranaerovirga pectinivora]